MGSIPTDVIACFFSSVRAGRQYERYDSVFLETSLMARGEMPRN